MIELTWPAQVSVAPDAACVVQTSRAFAESCTIHQPTGSATLGGAAGGGRVTITGAFADQEQRAGPVTIRLEVHNPANNRPGGRGFGLSTFATTAEGALVGIDVLADGEANGPLVPHLACTHPCRTCSPGADASCESCWQGDAAGPGVLSFLMRAPAGDAGGASGQGGRCQSGCDEGYTTDGDTENRVCRPCEEPCASCYDEGDRGDRGRCYACAPTHPLKLVGAPTCLATCGVGYYRSDAPAASATGPEAAATGTCSACEPPCADCEGGKEQCTACNATEPLHAVLMPETNRCIEACPAAYTAVRGVCRPCESPCATCAPGRPTACLSCDGSADTRVVWADACYPECPAGTTPDRRAASHALDDPDAAPPLVEYCTACTTGCTTCDDRRPDVCKDCGWT